MGLRIAAGLTAAVIVIAVVAAFIAAHRGPVGLAPAGEDPNVKAYRDMMVSDYNTMNASTSPSCSTILDDTCAAAAGGVVRTLQKWEADLNAFQTPPRFVVIDGQLRRHLNQAAADLNAAVAFQKAGDASGFTLAMNAAFYERAWIDPAAFTIEDKYAALVRTYSDAVRLARQSLDGCVTGKPGPGDVACSRLIAHRPCTAAAAQACESDILDAGTQLQSFMIALLQNPAPPSLTTLNSHLQAELAKADTALLAAIDGLLSGDGSKVDSAENSYYDAIYSADGDTHTISNP